MKKQIVTLSFISSALLMFGCSPSTTDNTEVLDQDNIEQSNIVEDNSLEIYTNDLDSKFFGRWTYTDTSEVLYITSSTQLEQNQLKMITDNQITITEDGKTRYLIRSGISDVKISGEIAIVESESQEKQAPARKSFSLNNIVVKLKHKISDVVKEYKVEVTTEEEKVGSIKDEVLYLKESVNGNFVIPETTDLAMPTGEIEFSVIDKITDKNTTIDISLSGEETDIGVTTLTDQPYNFKSYIEAYSDIDAVKYDDYNDEIKVDNKTYFANSINSSSLYICNVGTESISGSSFEIKPHDKNQFSFFKINSLNEEDGVFKSAAIGFEANECKRYTLSFSVVAPQTETKYRIDITIKDNFKQLTWNDYASVRVAPYTLEETQKITISSNQKEINGYLITQGNEVIYIQSGNSINIPKDPKAEYELVLSAKNISDEDVYQVSTGAVSNENMDSFVDVTRNEPDNNKSAATILALTGDVAMSYLAQGDIDYFILKDLPRVKTITQKLYHQNDELYVEFYTDLNISSLQNENFTITNSKNEEQLFHFKILDNKTLIFNFDNNLSDGKYKISFSNIQSSGGNFLEKTIEKDFEVENIQEVKIVEDIKEEFFQYIGNNMGYLSKNSYLNNFNVNTEITVDDIADTCWINADEGECLRLRSIIEIYNLYDTGLMYQTATLELNQTELANNVFWGDIWSVDTTHLLIEKQFEDKNILVLYDLDTKSQDDEIELNYNPSDIVIDKKNIYILSSDKELYKYTITEGSIEFIESYNDLNITFEHFAILNNKIFFMQKRVEDSNEGDSDDEDSDEEDWQNYFVSYNLEDMTPRKKLFKDYDFNDEPGSKLILQVKDNNLYINNGCSGSIAAYYDSNETIDFLNIKTYAPEVMFYVNNNYLYTGYENNLAVYDLNDIGNADIEPIAEYSTDNPNGVNNIEKPYMYNNYLYLGSHIWAVPLK